MIRIVVIFVCVVFMSLSIQAQEKHAPSGALYIEALGITANLLSVNAEAFLMQNKDTSVLFGTRLGFSISKNKYNKNYVLIFPAEFNLLYGGRRNYLEFGLGVVPYYNTGKFNDSLKNITSSFDLGISLRLGWRCHGRDGTLYRFAPLMLFESGFPKKTFNSFITIGFSVGLVF